MDTEKLVQQLASGLTPVRSRSVGRDALIVGGVAVVELLLFVASGAPRAHMHHAMSSMPCFLWKVTSLGVLAAVALVTALRSFDPARSTEPGLRRIGLVVAAALLAGWAIDLATVQPMDFWKRLDWPDGVQCVASMAILSVPVLIALGLLMRRGAATDLSGSGWAVGVAAAAWGALLFSMVCPYNDPCYVAVWFVTGCFCVALLSRLIIPIVNRW